MVVSAHAVWRKEIWITTGMVVVVPVVGAAQRETKTISGTLAAVDAVARQEPTIGTAAAVYVTVAGLRETKGMFGMVVSAHVVHTIEIYNTTGSYVTADGVP
jgi:hypothetical protein